MATDTRPRYESAGGCWTKPQPQRLRWVAVVVGGVGAIPAAVALVWSIVDCLTSGLSRQTLRDLLFAVAGVILGPLAMIATSRRLLAQAPWAHVFHLLAMAVCVLETMGLMVLMTFGSAGFDTVGIVTGFVALCVGVMLTLASAVRERVR